MQEYSLLLAPFFVAIFCNFGVAYCILCRGIIADLVGILQAKNECLEVETWLCNVKI